MKSVDKEKLRKIIMKNARLFQLTIKNKKDGYLLLFMAGVFRFPKSE